MSTRRLIALSLALLLALLPVHSGAAQTLAPASAKPAPAATPSVADLQHMVDTLKDEPQRQRLIQDLQALIAAQQQGAPAPPAEAATPSDILADMAGRVQQFGDDLVGAAGVLVDAPYAIHWAETQFLDDQMRRRWTGVFLHVAEILGASIIAGFVVWAAARLLRRRLVRPAGRGRLPRFSILLGQLVLDLLPIAAFAVTGEIMLSVVPPEYVVTIHVSTTLLKTVFEARLLIALARTILLYPREAGWTLLPIGEENANYLYIWIRRFVFWAVYGLGLCEAVWFMGVPGAVYAVLLRTVAFVLAILGVVFVLQNRHAVGRWMRPRPFRPIEGAEDGAEAIVAEPDIEAQQPRMPGTLDTLRHRLADVWHVLVIVYIVGLFAVYALRIEGGFSFVLRSTLLTLTIIVAARLLIRAIGRVAERGFAIPEDLKQRFPTLEHRANRYLPILTMIASTFIWAFAVLSLLEVWGVGSYSWLGTEAGRRVTGSLITIGVILVVTFFFWELINAGIDRYLSGIERNGSRTARGARMRTLLPLLRNVIWVTLLVVVLLLILSEIGVDITPLLGVSAVFGLAIGFGSQALVKDIITGLFILIEDIVAVGDVVDLSGGYSGVVEAISVRTIKLRDAQGTLQTIPFSEVTKVKNLSRDFAYVVIDLALPLSVEPDKVAEALAKVADAMSKEPAFAGSMVGPIEQIGVTSYGLAGMQYQARIKTLPLRQWVVGREFNKRLKSAFAEAGIANPPPMQMINFSDDVARLVEKLRPPMPGPERAAEAPAADAAVGEK